MTVHPTSHYTTTSDITLPQRTVLNSTMAYRESGYPGPNGAVFTREPDIIVYLAKRDSVGCADSALYRAESHRVWNIR